MLHLAFRTSEEANGLSPAVEEMFSLAKLPAKLNFSQRPAAVAAVLHYQTVPSSYVIKQQRLSISIVGLAVSCFSRGATASVMGGVYS